MGQDERRPVNEIREELAESRNRILNIVAGLSNSQFQWRLSSTGWSVAEILEHLCLAEGFVVFQANNILEEVDKFKIHLVKGKGGNMPRLARVKSLEDPNWPADSSPYAFPSGRFEKNQLVEMLVSTREQLNQCLYGSERNEPPTGFAAHPQFGRLSLREWLSIPIYHDNRHYRQIQRIIQAHRQ